MARCERLIKQKKSAHSCLLVERKAWRRFRLEVSKSFDPVMDSRLYDHDVVGLARQLRHRSHTAGFDPLVDVRLGHEVLEAHLAKVYEHQIVESQAQSQTVCNAKQSRARRKRNQLML